MLKSERQEMILEFLQEKKHITAKELSEKFYTSYSSIRRDLEELEASGFISRSYGRVELANKSSLLVSYPIRINKYSEQKRMIAKKAASLINDGDTLFIDPSSSCSFFAKELLNKRGITVITNNVEIMSIMSQSSFDVVCSGGIQSSPNRYALTGPAAEEAFRNIHADWAVFSARALTDDGQIFDVHPAEIALRNIMLQNSDKKIFLCDSSKFSSIATYYQCSLNKIDYLVSDKAAPPSVTDGFPSLVTL